MADKNANSAEITALVKKLQKLINDAAKKTNKYNDDRPEPVGGPGVKAKKANNAANAAETAATVRRLQKIVNAANKYNDDGPEDDGPEPVGGAGVANPKAVAAAKKRPLSGNSAAAVYARAKMAHAIEMLTARIGRQAIAADVNLYAALRKAGNSEAEAIEKIKAFVRTAKPSEANRANRASRKITEDGLNEALAKRLNKRVTRRRAYAVARKRGMSPKTAAAKVLANIPSLEKSGNSFSSTSGSGDD